MLLPEYFISPAKEKQRYEEHNNDVTDKRYQDFVSPITSAVINEFPETAMGLDYGCGTGPVAASELGKKNYQIILYDPYFRNDREALTKLYDFIICCEVMEHFQEPAKEFRKLFGLLKPGGKLYCKTALYSPEIDFEKWYYKNDPTHVFLYTKKSLEIIRELFRFSDVEIGPDLIVFRK
ncbi:class I SAM-dependent methyltransferase [Salegentibacter chungangensis]|uniref:Class I SAM-dependent methyltransferase n=1 Tax=Salegentibacter chungangensis TaxID=1335724 RepID=A0ABW3NRJ9_9FLAO